MRYWKIIATTVTVLAWVGSLCFPGGKEAKALSTGVLAGEYLHQESQQASVPWLEEKLELKDAFQQLNKSLPLLSLNLRENMYLGITGGTRILSSLKCFSLLDLRCKILPNGP